MAGWISCSLGAFDDFLSRDVLPAAETDLMSQSSLLFPISTNPNLLAQEELPGAADGAGLE